MAPTTPRLETLEDRLAPAVFGYGWPDAARLTVSFVTPPDTSSDTTVPAGWQDEVLRALQAWAEQGNVNLVVVPDSGDPLGTPGLTQGDPRFGDVRVAWMPLSPSSLAVAVPFSPTAGTWAGDVLLNSSVSFGPGGYDLFSVALHEAGHVFGVDGNHDDPNDVMFDFYNGVRTGISDAGIAAMRELYGTRKADVFEGYWGNGSFTKATDFANASLATLRTELVGSSNSGGGDAATTDRLRVTADLTTRADVDVYWYATPRDDAGFTLRLTPRGNSLLTARLVVLDERGRVVTTAVADRDGDALVRIDATMRQRYYFRVESGDPTFAIGAYSLELTPDNTRVLLSTESVAGRYLSSYVGDDTLATATPLMTGRVSGTNQLGFQRQGKLTGHADHYRLRVGSNSDSLDVQLSATAGMTVAVLDREGRVVASAVTGANGVANLRLAVEGGSLLYLRIGGGSSGDYALAGRLDAPPVQAAPATAGVLDAEMPQTTRGLELTRATLLRVELDVQTASAVEAAVEATLFDEQGNVVFRQVVTSGQTLGVNLFLKAGKYTWRFVGGTADGSPLSDTTFNLRQLVLDDPIGPALVDPTQVPAVEKPLWLPSGFYGLLSLVDPYGRPLSPITTPLPPGV